MLQLGIIVTRLFVAPHCANARNDSFRPLLNRVARKLTKGDKKAPVGVEVVDVPEEPVSLASAQVVEVPYPGSALALRLLRALEPCPPIVRLRILEGGTGNPYNAFYERATYHAGDGFVSWGEA